MNCMKQNYFKFYLTVLLNFILIQIYCQNDNRIGNYNYYELPNGKEDTIRFVMNNPQASKTIFFIQGSSPSPLFYNSDGIEKCFFNGLINKDDFNQSNFVLISKPGISISVPIELGVDTLTKNKLIFDKYNYKDYYVNSIKKVYEFLINENIISPDSLYIVGHSQGYDVTAKYVSIYPDDFDKIVCMSSSIFNVSAIKINQVVEKNTYGIYDNNYTKHLVDSITKRAEEIKILVQDTNRFDYYYLRRDHSFGFELNYRYLLKFNKPILVVYGLKDVASADNRLLKLIFQSYNKSNLSSYMYPNLNHNFMNIQYDNDGNIIKNDFLWPKVFKDILKWIETD